MKADIWAPFSATLQYHNRILASTVKQRTKKNLKIDPLCPGGPYNSFQSYVNFILSNKLVFGMENSKLQEILEKVISKTSDMLDEKFAKFEHSLRNDIVNLRNDLNNVKELNKKELSKLRESVNDIEDGQKFIEKEFEKQKEKIKDLMTKDNKKMFPENQRLYNKIKVLYQSQEENQIEINKLA